MHFRFLAFAKARTMHAGGISRWSNWAAAMLLSGFAGAALPAAPVPGDTAQLFARADAINVTTQ